MSRVTFDAATGRLEAPPGEMDRVLALGDEASDALAETGALVDGRLHAHLARALSAVRDPVCELGLQRGDREGRGWVSADVAALLVPGTEGRLALTGVPPAFLPAVLARMNDVSPRPRVEPAVRLRYAAGELAALLARREPPAGTSPEATAAATLVRTLREHWRVEASWPPSPESPGVRALEVVDTDAGMWLVIPDGGGVELWPSTPTMVFRLLTGLLPRDHELGQAGLA